MTVGLTASPVAEGTDTTADTTLRGHWLLLARVAWVAVVVLSVGLFIAGLPFSYDEAVAVCTEVDCGLERLLPEDAEALRDLGLSESFYARYFTGLVSVFALSFILVGGLIFWRRSNDWMAMLVSVALMSFGTSWTDVPRSFATANPEWGFAYAFVFLLGFTTLLLLFYLFPDSRVPGSGVRGRGSGERETTASSLAGKQQAREKEDNGGQGKDGPAGAIGQGGNGR